MAKVLRLVLSLSLIAAALLVTDQPEAARAGVGTEIVVLGGDGVVANSVAQHLATCTSLPVSRAAGSNRYATAAEISKSTHGAAATAYVGTGENFPDAVAAGSPAAIDGAPILLTRSGSLPGETSTELARLGVSNIYILGGAGVVSAAVETALGAFGTTQRLAGANRYATAAEISKARFIPAATDTAYVATGENFPDALAGGPAAAMDGAPVLLVNRDSVPQATASELTRLGVSTIVILGGLGVVSAGVATQLESFAATVVRRFGTNRYETAVEISKSRFNPGVTEIYIATGENFPDALAGAAAAGFAGGPILLVTRYTVPGPTAAEIARLTGMPCGAFDGTPATFGAGTWIVGAEVPPGTYRNDDSTGFCYGARLSGFGGNLGDIIANELSTAILVVTIEPTDVGFESSRCGTWTNDIRYRAGSTAAPFGSGTWFVNDEVAPGTWRNNDSSNGCYWERKAAFSWLLADIITNDFTFDISTVTISDTDEGFYTDDCGTWTKIG